MLHPLFRRCWEVSGPPPEVFGSGANVLPMLHVDDLAKYVVEVAAAAAVSPAAVPPYLLVADEGRSTQAEVVEAVSKLLGKGGAR